MEFADREQLFEDYDKFSYSTSTQTMIELLPKREEYSKIESESKPLNIMELLHSFEDSGWKINPRLLRKRNISNFKVLDNQKQKSQKNNNNLLFFFLFLLICFIALGLWRL